MRSGTRAVRESIILGGDDNTSSLDHGVNWQWRELSASSISKRREKIRSHAVSGWSSSDLYLRSELMKMLKGRFESLVWWNSSWQRNARSTPLTPPRIDTFRRAWRTGGSVYPSAFHTTTSNVTSSPIILSRSSSQCSTAVACCSSFETLYYPNSSPLSHFEKMFGKPGDSAAIVYDGIGRFLSLILTGEKPPMPW